MKVLKNFNQDILDIEEIGRDFKLGMIKIRENVI